MFLTYLISSHLGMLWQREVMPQGKDQLAFLASALGAQSCSPSHPDRGISVGVHSKSSELRCLTPALATASLRRIILMVEYFRTAVVRGCRRSSTMSPSMPSEFAEFQNPPQQFFLNPTRIPNHAFSRSSLGTFRTRVCGTVLASTVFVQNMADRNHGSPATENARPRGLGLLEGGSHEFADLIFSSLYTSSSGACQENRFDCFG